MVRKRTRVSRADPAPASVVPISTPAPVIGRPRPSLANALPVVLPLIGIGLLLLGASAVSAWYGPWPQLVGPLYPHRQNLAAVGVGAIALALLCLNVFVLF